MNPSGSKGHELSCSSDCSYLPQSGGLPQAVAWLPTSAAGAGSPHVSSPWTHQFDNLNFQRHFHQTHPFYAVKETFISSCVASSSLPSKVLLGFSGATNFMIVRGKEAWSPG